MQNMKILYFLEAEGLIIPYRKATVNVRQKMKMLDFLEDEGLIIL